jgi:two-component SAPR family response regulator
MVFKDRDLGYRRGGFRARGVIGWVSEFVLYFILEGRGRHEFLSTQVCEVLWPGVAPKKAQSYFHQIVAKLRSVFREAPQNINKNGIHYRLDNIRMVRRPGN